jgi:hypothetical protein
MTVFQLKITLEGTSPPIWRRVHVPATLRLDGLHRVVQAAMGWTNSHIHEFRFRDRTFSDPTFDPDGGLEIDDEHDVSLDSLVTRRGQKLLYRYDFGDNWRHEILIEKALERDERVTYPVCVGGERACPPEDVGGVGEYSRILEALANAEHADHDETLTWIGGAFDPESFDVDRANRGLRSCRADGRSTL